MGASSSKEPWEQDSEGGESPSAELTAEAEIERVFRACHPLTRPARVHRVRRRDIKRDARERPD